MSKILLLNGPNINLIGTYDTQLFGNETLTDIDNALQNLATNKGHEYTSLHSNAESVLIERVQATMQDKTQFIILNPGGLAYSSVSLRDALSAAKIPFIEVHLSNIYQRESFRKKSYFSDIAVGVIVGLGAKVYELAMLYAIDHLTIKHEKGK